MAIIYSTGAITARLNAVVTIIGLFGNGFLIIRAQNTVLSTIALANPCGTANRGVLTFTGTLLDPAAAATGTADNVIITNAIATTIISGLTVGIPGGSQDVIISNGLNSTLITAGQVVALLSAQITGS